MRTIDTIINEAQAQGLPFLLIGGQAIVLHGYARMTYDVDIVVLSSDINRWRALFFSQGYTSFHITDAFAQFQHADGDFPIDLMRADDATFAKLAAGSMEKDWEGMKVLVPTPLHLIAMKLHALKTPHRFSKDFGDVVELMRLHNIDFHSPEFQAILDRYASPEIRALLETNAKLNQ